ncbi:MAG: DUF2911 domain-containing protein [Bacteroidia bacterium]|nr:DUF2911 domain-containing protein [Bacteroidia bacterium]
MKKFSFTLLFALMVFAGSVYAQGQLTTPDPSPKAFIKQRVGLTDISVEYHRPFVKGREIWGKIVGIYETDQLEKGQTPWRAGANENTIVSFSTDVKVEGKVLAAGSYGLHIIPTKSEWTVIFSENTTSWGSYFYKVEEDVLRVKVNPGECSFHEALTFDIEPESNDAARIVLRWEKKEIPIKVAINTHEVVLANMRNELRGVQGFTWQGFNTAAAYCLKNNIALEEGLKWSDVAISREKNFSTLSVKSGLLSKKGETAEAETLMASAMELATNTELNNYGYELLNQGKLDAAIEVFKQNTERNPDDPNVFDSLGEGYVLRNAEGDKKLAIKALETSLSMNPPENVKLNSLRLLKQLGVKKYAEGAR